MSINDDVDDDDYSKRWWWVEGGGGTGNITFERVLFQNFKVSVKYIHWPKMKTLHFISLNNCFVSIHVVVRFTHAYRDIVADNDYAIVNQISSLFKRQRLKNVILTLHVLRKSWFINSFKTDKKTFAAEYW